MTSPRPILFLLLILAVVPSRADEFFPQPAELQHDIDFWVDIFTLYRTDQGVLHDSRNLAVVYEHIDFDTLGPEDIDLEPLEKLLPDIEFYPTTEPGQIKKRLAQAEIVIVNKVTISDATIYSAGELKLICLAATGTDNVSLEAAAERGRQRAAMRRRRTIAAWTGSPLASKRSASSLANLG